VKFDGGVDQEKQAAAAGYLAMEKAYLAAKKNNALVKGRYVVASAHPALLMKHKQTLLHQGVWFKKQE
jgi:hypothetical protein